jgi:hypothetical protein
MRLPVPPAALQVRFVSPLARRRLNGLEQEVRPLVGRDITLPAGPALSRDDEVDLLLRVLGAGNVSREMRAAFEDRVLTYLLGLC